MNRYYLILKNLNFIPYLYFKNIESKEYRIVLCQQDDQIKRDFYFDHLI